MTLAGLLRATLVAGLTVATLSVSPETRAQTDVQPSTQAQADNLIVPGVRMGQVRLGMTDVDLYNLLGNPSSTQPGYRELVYSFPNVNIVVAVSDSKHTVVRIVTNDPRYAMASGIRVGSGALEIAAKLGIRLNCNSPLGITACNYGDKGYFFQLGNNQLINSISVVNN